MKINFVVKNTYQSGGMIVIFKVANFLAKKGHEINIISLEENSFNWTTLNSNIKVLQILPKYKLNVIKFINKLSRSLNFSQEICFEKFFNSNIPPADITIATSNHTALPVFYYGTGKKYYYVQHYESIFESNDKLKRKVDATYHLPLKKFAVSKWLQRHIKKLSGESVGYVGNGVDRELFKESDAPKQNILLGSIRGADWKGDFDLLKAFELVQVRNPKIKIVLVLLNLEKNYLTKFLKERNISIKNYTLIRNASHKKNASLYANAKVFGFASHIEGFGLPPLESMSCGTPVVTTICKGNEDYVRPGKNCIAVEPKNPEMLANGIIELIENQELYNSIREEGIQTAKKFSWRKVVERLEKELELN